MAAGDFDLPAEVRKELTDAMPLAMGYPFEWTEISGPNLRKAEFEPPHAVRIP
jgi:hypothetical protein